jgi:vacuolar protein sorting-associated protein 18
LLTLQDEIVKGKAGSIDRTEALSIDGGAALWQPGTQRTLLSQSLTAQTQNGNRQTNSIGRNLLSAGDRLRDLIVPDALVTVITSPAGWIPGIGGAQKNALIESATGKRLEKLRSELEDILASACPLCESVIAGLDKSFTKGEPDSSWEV